MSPVELTTLVGMYFFVIAATTGAVVSPGVRAGNGRRDPSRVTNPRQLHRFATSTKAILTWQGANGATQTLNCRLMDISDYGAGVRTKLAFGLGTHLCVHIPALHLSTTANVRRCEAAGLRFDLGLEFRGPLFRT
jgi:hypothetical protein